MRAVLDPNVLIFAALSRSGTPARLVRAAGQGQFDLITSPLLLAELKRALSYPKLRGRFDHGEAAGVVETVERLSHVVEDPPGPASVTSTDPGDAYLVALAEAQRAALVSGDRHLLILSDVIPVFRPAEFLARLGEEPRRGSRGC